MNTEHTTDSPSDHVVRYVVTHVDQNGMRTLCGPAQGRFTYETPEQAQSQMESMMANNAVEHGRLAGVYGLPLQVRAVKCYPGHFDPKGVYFEDAAEQVYAERPRGR